MEAAVPGDERERRELLPEALLLRVRELASAEGPAASPSADVSRATMEELIDRARGHVARRRAALPPLAG